MDDSFIANISIRSRCPNSALVSITDGDVEWMRLAIPPADREIDEPTEIIESRVDLRLNHPLLIGNPQVTAISADIDRWHLRYGTMEINIK
jgi:hypothetical protein